MADYLGKNEKTKVIVKLQKSGSGPPGREPALSAEEQKAMMMHAYRRQEELKVIVFKSLNNISGFRFPVLNSFF